MKRETGTTRNIICKEIPLEPLCKWPETKIEAWPELKCFILETKTKIKWDRPGLG